MHGWTGKTVTIDLADSEIKESKSNSDNLRSFIGGRGLGVKLYCDAIDPGIDPLTPENILIFATGPLTGTLAPMSGRHAMVSKSPLTGTIFDSSSGGFFGKELKFAGIDALIIKARLESLFTSLSRMMKLKSTMQTSYGGKTSGHARISCHLRDGLHALAGLASGLFP